MLSDRERRVLARMERHLWDTDPAFCGLFQRPGSGVRRSMHAAGALPCLLLAAGLALMVLGGITAAVPVAVSGILLAVLSLGLAHSTTTGPGLGLA